jgi:hypothetical protein
MLLLLSRGVVVLPGSRCLAAERSFALLTMLHTSLALLPGLLLLGRSPAALPAMLLLLIKLTRDKSTVSWLWWGLNLLESATAPGCSTDAAVAVAEQRCRKDCSCTSPPVQPYPAL